MDELITFLVENDLPFRIVENPSFRNMFDLAMKGPVKVPSADTAKTKLMGRYGTTFATIKTRLQEAPGKISYTTDCWTSVDQRPYMAITAHWISADWKLCELLLNFHHLPPPHTGGNICTAFCESLGEMGVATKASCCHAWEST